MNKAETWLGERMSVRLWLAALCGVAAVAAVVVYLAVAALRADDADAATAGPVGMPVAGTAGEQRPTAVCMSLTVGTFSTLDRRAGMTLDLYPMQLPVAWTVTIRSVASGPAPAGEVDLTGPEVAVFANDVDEAVRKHDPDHDLAVGTTAIHAVAEPSGDYHYELRNVGTMRLDADGMADLKRMLDKAQAERAWLLPRTVPLRVPGLTAPPAVAAADGGSTGRATK